MACSLRFYGDGISFRVVFSQSFWLRVLPGGARLVQPNGCQREGFWEVVRHVVSPFDLPELFRLVDLPSWNNSCKWLLWGLARVGSFSQCASPNIIINIRSIPTWILNWTDLLTHWIFTAQDPHPSMTFSHDTRDRSELHLDKTSRIRGLHTVQAGAPPRNYEQRAK